jgi:hypothetical protein
MRGTGKEGPRLPAANRHGETGHRYADLYARILFCKGIVVCMVYVTIQQYALPRPGTQAAYCL